LTNPSFEVSSLADAEPMRISERDNTVESKTGNLFRMSPFQVVSLVFPQQ